MENKVDIQEKVGSQVEDNRQEVEMISGYFGTACNRAAKGQTVTLGYKRPEDGEIGVPIYTHSPSKTKDCVVKEADFIEALRNKFGNAPGDTNQGKMNVVNFIERVGNGDKTVTYFKGTCQLPQGKLGILEGSYDPKKGHKWVITGGGKING